MSRGNGLQKAFLLYTPPPRLDRRQSSSGSKNQRILEQPRKKFLLSLFKIVLVNQPQAANLPVINNCYGVQGDARAWGSHWSQSRRRPETCKSVMINLSPDPKSLLWRPYRESRTGPGKGARAVSSRHWVHTPSSQITMWDYENHSASNTEVHIHKVRRKNRTALVWTFWSWLISHHLI